MPFLRNLLTSNPQIRAALAAAEKLGIHHEREGHDFSRAVKSLKVNVRFSAWGWLFARRVIFPQPL
jgi:hypothetical protein